MLWLNGTNDFAYPVRACSRYTLPAQNTLRMHGVSDSETFVVDGLVPEVVRVRTRA
jgi:hypothetical protein